MLLLMLFALLAGAGTAITPCVLPVLPALLSGERRRRPPPAARDRARAGDHVHDRDRRARPAREGRRPRARRGPRPGDRRADRVRRHAAGPGARRARLQAPLSRLARFGPKTRGDGFWSGLGVGAALGFVCAPCAGPILAAVTSVSASSGADAADRRWSRSSYAVGLCAVLLVYGFGGRAVIDRIRADDARATSSSGRSA